MDRNKILNQLKSAGIQKKRVGLRKAVGFRFGEIQIGERFHRGSYLHTANAWRDARFFLHKPSSLDHKLQLQNMTKIRFPNVMNLKVNHLFDGQVVIGYEAFDFMFLPWLKANPKHAFYDPDGSLHAWWQVAILSLFLDLRDRDGKIINGDVLEALDSIHERKKNHGGMNRDDSYVIVGSKLKLINVGLEERAGMKDEEKKQADRRDLAKFLTKHVLPLHGSVEWKDFIMELPRNELKQSKKHPVLLASLKRFAYLREILDYVKYNMGAEYQEGQTDGEAFELFLRDEPLWRPIYDWRDRLSREPFLKFVFRRDLNRTLDGTRLDKNTLHLIAFIENVIDHFGEPPLCTSVVCPPKGDIYGLEKKFSKCFPEYLQILHRLLIEEFPDHKITSTDYGEKKITSTEL